MSKAIGRLLRAAGLKANCFPSAEALLQTDAADGAFCMVVDVHLPGISGLELRRQLMKSGRRSPVIFITAHDDEETRNSAINLGCSAYFRKPFDGKALLEAIARLSNTAGQAQPKP